MNYTTKIIREVDYISLDDAITEFLKSKGLDKRYESVAYEEWSNYESHSFSVQAKASEGEIKEIMEGKLHYKTQDILNWMCAEGKIEEGEYLVSINW